MYELLLESLGLAKNEAKIYESLLTEGESNVSSIATKAQVHRRNVYDSLQRLIEKGLVFEIIDTKENHYQAVDPRKLAEVITEKQNALNQALPHLEQLYNNKPSPESVFIYRGLEGWKNYMRDIIRVGQDDFIIGAKGVWGDPKIASFAKSISDAAKKKGITFNILFDASSAAKAVPVGTMLNAQYRFLPKGFETISCIECFDDHTIFLSDCSDGNLKEDLSITVIINPLIAESVRTWFKLLWSVSTKPNKNTEVKK